MRRIIHFTEYSVSKPGIRTVAVCGQEVLTLKPNGFQHDEAVAPVCEYCEIINRLEQASWYVITERES